LIKPRKCNRSFFSTSAVIRSLNTAVIEDTGDYDTRVAISVEHHAET
jgi:hypothetical protein